MKMLLLYFYLVYKVLYISLLHHFFYLHLENAVTGLHAPEYRRARLSRESPARCGKQQTDSVSDSLDRERK